MRHQAHGFLDMFQMFLSVGSELLQLFLLSGVALMKSSSFWES